MVGICKTRRVGMMAACAVSVGVGTTLVWYLVPEALRQVNTAELVAVLGLFLLPAATLLAFTMERNSRRGLARADAGGEWTRDVGGLHDDDARGAVAAVMAGGAEVDRSWAPVWAAVMSGERVEGAAGAGTGVAAAAEGPAVARREAAQRRPGLDAGSRRRREEAGAGVVGVR